MTKSILNIFKGINNVSQERFWKLHISYKITFVLFYYLLSGKIYNCFVERTKRFLIAPRFSVRYAIVDPSVASSSRMSRREQNYPARNAKFTGAAHKSAVIPSVQCEGRTKWARAHIVGAYCARGRQYIYDPLSQRDACGRLGKKRAKKNPGTTWGYFAGPNVFHDLIKAIPPPPSSRPDEMPFPCHNHRHKNVSRNVRYLFRSIESW